MTTITQSSVAVPSEAVPSASVLTTLGGRYLTFVLGSEEFGLQILKVKEIIGQMDITRIPCASPHVKGVINLRGQVIPVIDLRARFAMDSAKPTDTSCIIVSEVKASDPGRPDATRKISCGIIVDRVCEVLTIPSDNIEPTPEVGLTVDEHFILGMGKVGTSIKILLDIDRVLDNTHYTPIASAPDDNSVAAA